MKDHSLKVQAKGWLLNLPKLSIRFDIERDYVNPDKTKKTFMLSFDLKFIKRDFND